MSTGDPEPGQLGQTCGSNVPPAGTPSPMWIRGPRSSVQPSSVPAGKRKEQGGPVPGAPE